MGAAAPAMTEHTLHGDASRQREAGPQRPQQRLTRKQMNDGAEHLALLRGRGSPGSPAAPTSSFSPSDEFNAGDMEKIAALVDSPVSRERILRP